LYIEGKNSGPEPPRSREKTEPDELDGSAKNQMAFQMKSEMLGGQSPPYDKKYRQR
jgi:hypothetical protein